MWRPPGPAPILLHLPAFPQVGATPGAGAIFVPAAPWPSASRTQAPTLRLSLPPLGLLHPGPRGPEDLRVEGEECQRPGEDGSHEPGTGGHGGQGGEGRETDAAGRGKWGQTRCSTRQRPWKALGLSQPGVLRVSSVAALGGSLHARGQAPGNLGASSGCELDRKSVV